MVCLVSLSRSCRKFESRHGRWVGETRGGKLGCMVQMNWFMLLICNVTAGSVFFGNLGARGRKNFFLLLRGSPIESIYSFEPKFGFKNADESSFRRFPRFGFRYSVSRCKSLTPFLCFFPRPRRGPQSVADSINRQSLDSLPAA